MEYYYAYFEINEPVHFVRVDTRLRNKADDIWFKKMIVDQNGEGKVIIVTKNEDGSYVIPIISYEKLIEDETLDGLHWARRVWEE